MKNFDYSVKQKEALRELINIGVGKGAEVLNSLLSAHVKLEVPSIVITDPEHLAREMGISTTLNLACVEMSYDGFFSGNVHMIFPEEDASKIVGVLTGEGISQDEFDGIKSATMTEIGNIVINAVLGNISNIFHKNLKYSVPTFHSGPLDELVRPFLNQSNNIILLAKTRFNVETLKIEGNLILYFTLVGFKDFLSSLEKIHE